MGLLIVVVIVIDSFGGSKADHDHDHDILMDWLFFGTAAHAPWRAQ